MRRSDYFLLALFLLQLFFYQTILTNLKFFFVSLKFSTDPLNHTVSILYAIVFIVLFVNIIRLVQAYSLEPKEAEAKISQVFGGSVAAIAVNFLITVLTSRLA